MTATDLTAITDDEARMRAFQIIGSDIPPGTAAFTGNWHEALKTTAARWAGPADTDTNPAA
jgi:hypothetical protein